MTEDTIVAIATPPGRGGVGIVRLSGKQALAIGLKITQKTSLKTRFAHYCSFYNNTSEIIDSGIVLYFQSPNSFTGEDIIEFQGHGSPLALDILIKTCIEQGARMARPGEFSQRAFLNDRLDLVQAEAIADLIHASSETAARMAVRSLQGAFSEKINSIHDSMIHLRMYVEAAMDFPEEEIDFLNDGKIAEMLQNIIDTTQEVRKKATQGAILREGIQIVIAGKPNVGKSTLINALADKEVAIVTDIAGTTRDVMREYILLDDIPVHVIDTAGIRNSSDVVEQEGIKRAWQEIKKSDCVLMMVDLTDRETSHHELHMEIRNALGINVPVITIFNKSDLLNIPPRIEGENIYLSAQSREGLPLLKSRIKECIGYQPSEGIFLARARHCEALDITLNLLLHGQEQLQIHKAGELLADDLLRAHNALCAITGQFTSDDLLGEIFSDFCIGK